MDEKRNEIILFENQGVKLEVNLKDETVWLTQEQMAKLFGKAKSTINEHIKNVYKEGELVENETMTKFGNSEFADKPTNYYNLDMIISIGYRVKSQNGILFRKWATNVLKDYMLKGYAINQKRLDYLEKTVKLIDIANRIDERLEGNDAKEILKVIAGYTKALDLLDDYDHKTLKKIQGNLDTRKIEYQECISIINKLRFNEDKCRCIAAGLLLNYALRQEKVDNHSEIVMVDIIKACDGYDKSYDYKIKYQKKGKPYFKDYKELNFNITHSGKYVACAISDTPIGIDMEGNRKDVCSVARRFFNKDESEWVCMAESESEQKERFLKIWTFKEAYSKMTGDGIALCLKQPYFQGLKNLNVIEKSFEEYRICVVKK